MKYYESAEAVMTSIALVNVQDVVRALGDQPDTATPKSVAEWFRAEYLNKPRGHFNHDPSMFVTGELFKGRATVESAVNYCLQNGNPKGRTTNAAIIKAVAPYAASQVSTCHRIGFLAVSIGRLRRETVYLGIKAPLVRVALSEAFVVVPGFRGTFRPNSQQVTTLCSIISSFIAQDDYALADIEYLDAVPCGQGVRTLNVVHGKDRELYDADTVDQFLDIYVRGLSLLETAGVDVQEPSLKGYRIFDPSEPGFRW